MQTIKVFPDFMSSGLWLQRDGLPHVNTDESEVAHFVPAEVIIALKYWHHIWEVCVDDDFNSTMSPRYKNEWHEDGRAIVAAMNKAAEDADETYTFVYVE
jgi:hypothetical protein